MLLLKFATYIQGGPKKLLNTVLPKSSLSMTCELSSNCSENYESSAFNDVVTNLCESMSEVNAVKYVA